MSTKAKAIQFEIMASEETINELAFEDGWGWDEQGI